MSTAAMVHLGAPKSRASRIAHDFLAVMSPGAASIAEPKDGDMHLAHTILPGAAAGVIGFLLLKKHPVLGFLAGDAIGLNTGRLFRGGPGDYKAAATNLGVAAAGIVASLIGKRHPFWWWWFGHIAGAGLTAFVPGSNAQKFLANFKRST